MATTARAITPIGTLTRNTQRQPASPRISPAPAKNPPMTGPSTLDAPNTARKYAWYRDRSRGGTRSPMIASASENKPPAPSPWTARNAASWYIDPANEQAAEPSTKIVMAATKKRLRP